MLAFVKRNFRWIAGGFLLTYFSSFGQTYFISASVAEWQSAFALSHGEFGRLFMFATLASAAFLPWVGRLVDFLPEHHTIMITAPLLAVAALMAAFASSVLVLGVAIFMLRLFGQGMMTHIALTATGRCRWWCSVNRKKGAEKGPDTVLPVNSSRAGCLSGKSVSGPFF